MESQKSWFDEVLIGDIKCSNRIVMAALTRERADQNGMATDIVVKHY